MWSESSERSLGPFLTDDGDLFEGMKSNHPFCRSAFSSRDLAFLYAQVLGSGYAVNSLRLVGLLVLGRHLALQHDLLSRNILPCILIPLWRPQSALRLLRRASDASANPVEG